ncbi:MAG: hypothetical protein KI790_02500 [Cyclobacteriaceae bacterium]|nr:hypothetical protein [Cyclobacteriaceae bacterium HetDA_MAG_MS6]
MTGDPEKYRCYFGEHNPPVTKRTLRSGDLTMTHEAGFLRYIKCGGYEVLRMIYFAVRDQNWTTIPGEISEETIKEYDEGFHITYKMYHDQNGIKYQWSVELEGTDNEIDFKIYGESKSDFLRNRIGFCVLHPIQECSGKPCEVTYVSGEVATLTFPELIAPHQPMYNIRKMRWPLGVDGQAELHLEGDTFEMEDQRNWTDHSYKTYCTPLEESFPVEVRSGDKVSQHIKLKITDIPKDAYVSNRTIISNSWKQLSFPQIGVELGPPTTGLDLDMLKEVGFRHVRVEAEDTDLDTALDRLSFAKNLKIPVELVLKLAEDNSAFISMMESHLRRLQVNRVLLLALSQKVSHEADFSQTISQIRSLFPNVLVGVGTDYYFAEFNREPPAIQSIDFVSYSINPQVHAFDTLSLTETLEAQQYTVQTAKSLCVDSGLQISPVTLLPRSNPDATDKNSQPISFDPRQMGLYGMVWTMGSIKYLAEQAVDSISYFKTHGPDGIMANDTDHSVYPVYFVFRMILATRPTYVQATKSNHPLKVEAFSWKDESRDWLMLANFTESSQSFQLEGFNTVTGIKSLDEHNMKAACSDPEKFLAIDFSMPSSVENLEISPYGLLLVRLTK